MHGSEGWAFLVARGRRAGYRTVLAPAFLVDANLQRLLEESTGLSGLGASNTGVVRLDTPAGRVSIGYTRERLGRADLEQADFRGGEVLTDEHGRPLEMVYGVVSKDQLDEPVDPEDLREARMQAVISYRSFLDDEEGHRVDSYDEFELRTPPRAVGEAAALALDAGPPAPAPPAPAMSPAPLDRGTPPTPPRSARPRAGPRRRGLAVLLAVGVGFLVAAVILATRGSSAEAVDPSWLDDPPRGSVTFCAGEDVSASHRRSLRDYNRKRAPLSRATFAESSFTADAQHGQYLKALERGSDDCDVISLDVIYTAEFAARGLLYDMTPYLEAGGRRERFDPRAMRTASYEGRLWGVPKQLDVGVLYYRADRVPRPTSWQDVYRRAMPGSPSELPGLRLQSGAFEGTTVVFLELAYSAGARPIVSADGKTAQLDQPQVLDALMFLRNAVRDRVTPDVQQTDLGNLSVYERGRATFLRGWPFVAARLRDDAATDPVRRATAAGTAIAALPPWNAGGNSVAVLGGHNLVIPRSAGNPSAALHLIAFLTSGSQIRKDVEEDAQIPVLDALTNEPDLGDRSLLSAIEKTDVIARPSIENYATISRIISRGVTAILDGRAGRSSIRAWLQEMQHDVQSELDAGQ